MKMLEELAEVVRKMRAFEDAESLTSMNQLLGEASHAAYMLVYHHHTTITDMAKRLEAAERDAARYRWLRNDASDDFEVTQWMSNDLKWVMNVIDPDGMDEAIDAAMQEPTDRRTPERPES